MFDVKDADPILLRPLFKIREDFRFAVSFLWLIVLASPLFLAAWSTGEIGLVGGLTGAKSDFETFFGTADPDGRTTFGLLRDYPTLATLITASATIPVMFATCKPMNEQIDAVRRWEGIRSDGGTTSVKPMATHVLESRNFFHSMGRKWWIFLIFGTISIHALHTAFMQPSSFQLLSSGSEGPVMVEWWAADDSDIRNRLAYYVSGSLLLYVFIRNNMLGYAYLRFWIRLDKDGWFGIDVLNGDGYYGWAPLRRVLIRVYVAMLLSAVATISLFSVLDLRGFVLGSPILLLFLFSIPMHGLVPLYLLKRNGERWQGSRIEDLRRRFAIDSAGLNQAEAPYLACEGAYREAVERILAMKIRIFRPVSLLVALVGYVVTLAPAFLGASS